jgi:ribose-phosphate pyrophosphokinase
MLLFSGSSNPELGKRVASELGVKLGKATISRFADGEVMVKLEERMRGEHVVLVQSLCNPVNDNIMELLLMADAARRAGASWITAIVPYLGYARQDRRVVSGEPVSARVVAEMIERVGIDELITVSAHSAQLEGFFTIPYTDVNGMRILVNTLAERLGRCVLVAPDLGSMKVVKKLAGEHEFGTAVIHKERVDKDKVEARQIIGDVKGEKCVIIDDIISTGGTMKEAAMLLKQASAKEIYIAAVHGVFAGNAIELFNTLDVKEVIVCNTIPQHENENKIKHLNVVDMGADIACAITTSR